DYYIELQRHGMAEQNRVNEVLVKWAKKYNVKIIASNDSHYVDQQDSNAHDILLCINTGEKQSTPTVKDFGDDDSNSFKGKRFAFFNDQFYFKTTSEMTQLFSDIPEAIDNTGEIVDKITPLKLKQDIMLPNFQIPTTFLTQDDYLHHLTYSGAKERYRDITPEVEERLNFELNTIRIMGFAGYFLIVADFIKAGRDIGVFIGPGRGSAAGSAVAYCIGITNIDPIKYNLLFERFLNPDRKSMPDIDTDFDDEGRQKVIDYVVEKYGKNQVAQIVTYGTMAAKMSIKDVARVMDLPLQDSNMLAKLVPDKPGIELKRVLKAPMTGEASLETKEGLTKEDLEDVKKLRAILGGSDLQAKVLKEALVLEGSVRGTGIHASAIIIAPKDLTEIVPISASKETELYITQYDGRVIEDAGVIKMDFLGLKTLTIMRDALRLIKENHGIDIVIDDIPLDDPKTFEMYQRGDTNGTFQFESAGMQKHLINLKPDKFADLIAMNALYRPGPIEYIPNFIARKHGREAITYDLPEMEEFLADTYGITVYQEQVMLLSQKLAGFSKGDADILRKAMGKKDRYTLDKMKDQFITGATEKGLPSDKLEKIWTDWEKFAQYAFNKSHSTCYAFVAFQTAYLKAHYPGEYMSSVLTHNLSNIDKITFFMDECKRMGVPVLGPDVNESQYQFAVNKSGQIRFGMGAVKGVGEAAVISIVNERNEKGPYKSIFDFVRRINLRSANKKTFESLANAGGLDSFEIHRATYFHIEGNDNGNFLEKVIRYGGSHQDGVNSAQVSLFGEDSSIDMPEPKIPVCEPWSNLEQLKNEKDVVGFFISGHPLDTYKLEMDNFCFHSLSDIKKIEENKNKDLVFGGIVTNVHNGVTKTGNPWGKITIEDYQESSELAFFGEDYVKFKPYMVTGLFLYVKGKISERFRNSGNFEFKVSNIQLLSELRDKLARSITVNVSLKELNDEFMDKLNDIIAKNNAIEPRNCTLQFRIFDTEENISVVMPSKKIKLNPNNDLLDLLKENGLEYKLN
ncbi:MAG: DNA polymerase III subunit alpha, partial [Bacteroidetes bacterium]|nr:DNA polymerase III subunit alpha [Bacteroidota bacterium]